VINLKRFPSHDQEGRKKKEEAEQTRNAWIQARGTENAKKKYGDNATPEQIQKGCAEARMAVEGGALEGSFILTVIKDGKEIQVSVDDILDEPATYHESDTLDPLDPDYDGRRKVGRLYLDGEEGVLHSFAHGAKKYTLVKSSSEINGPYANTDSGLYLLPQSEEGKWEFISSPITPLAHLRGFDGKGHTLLLRVFDGEIAHEVPLKKSQILRPSELIEILADHNQEVPVEPKLLKHLQKYLLRLKPKRKMRCVEKSGWHKRMYVFPDGEVVGKNEGGESIYLTSIKRPPIVTGKHTSFSALA
jgi:hypothetical protein